MRGRRFIVAFADKTGLRFYLHHCAVLSLQNLNSLQIFNRIFLVPLLATNRHERYYQRNNLR